MPPITAKTPGAGSNTLSFDIPNPTIDVESVYVTIDASAAGSDVTAELTITDQSGVVIATKKQGSTVPAGSQGSATWALRLADESTSTPVTSGIQFDVNNVGDWLEINTTDTLSNGVRIVNHGDGGITLADAGASGIQIEGDQGVGISASVANGIGIVDTTPLAAGAGVQLFSQHGPIQVICSDATFGNFSVTSQIMRVLCQDAVIITGMRATGTDASIELGPATAVGGTHYAGAVWVPIPGTPNPIFLVDPVTKTVHIQTGTTILADL